MTFVLKAFGWKGAPIVAVAALLTLISVFSNRFEVIGQIFDAVEGVEGMEECTGYILKILGIGYIAGICSDICKELGESAIASTVMTAAKIESLVIISPMILEIMTLGLELVG